MNLPLPNLASNSDRPGGESSGENEISIDYQHIQSVIIRDHQHVRTRTFVSVVRLANVRVNIFS